jgi:sporulation protein YlmC with PRC-barrel domain
MRLGKSLIGNPVYGIRDGRKLGEVRDLYLDDTLTAVVGIYLGREGLLRPTRLFVESGDIALYGIDAVLAESTFTVREEDEAPEPPGWLRLDEFRGREVRTPGGTRIGRVGDVALDEEARVTGFSLTNLSVKGPVAEADAVARRALVDVEDEDGVMTMDLAEAEQALLEIDPGLLFAQPAPPEAGAQSMGAEFEEAPESFEQGESDVAN